MTAVERLRAGCRLEEDITELIEQHQALANALQDLLVNCYIEGDDASEIYARARSALLRTERVSRGT